MVKWHGSYESHLHRLAHSTTLPLHRATLHQTAPDIIHAPQTHFRGNTMSNRSSARGSRSTSSRNTNSSGLYNIITAIFTFLSVFLCICSLLLYARVLRVPSAFDPRSYTAPIVTPNQLPTPLPTAIPSNTPVPTFTFTPPPSSATPNPTLTPRPSITPFIEASAQATVSS